MGTLFPRAKAAKKVAALLEEQCGIPRSELSCDARLESDLGVVGDDVYDVLEGIESDGVDLSRFDCHDWITPEGLPILPVLPWMMAIAGLTTAFLAALPDWPDGIVLSLAFSGAIAVVYGVSRLLPRKECEEIRVRHLIDSVESGCWISPRKDFEREALKDARLQP